MAKENVETYKILLLISSLILLMLWSGSVHQLCITKVPNTTRLTNAILLLIFTTSCILLNSLVYLSSFYPNFSWQGSNITWDIQMISNAIEAITLLIGFHIGRIVVLNMIQKMYLATNTKTPKFVKHSLYFVECFMVISITICYSCGYIFPNASRMLRYSFYIAMGFTIILQDASVLVIINKLLYVMHAAKNRDVNNVDYKVQSAIHAINTARLFLIFIIIICFGFIALSVEVIYNYMQISLDIRLIDTALHSLLEITIITFFEWWIFLKRNCCVVEHSTVCLFCCGDFCVFYCPCWCQYHQNVDTLFALVNSKEKYQILGSQILIDDSEVDDAIDDQKLCNSMDLNKLNKTITPMTDHGGLFKKSSDILDLRASIVSEV